MTLDDRAIRGLRRVAVREDSAAAELNKTREQQRLSQVRSALLDRVQKIGQSSDLSTLLAAERFLVQNELDRYANSSSMVASLTAAVAEIKAIEKLLPLVADPFRYKIADDLFSLTRSKVRGVPDDEARKSFRSHRTRVQNLDRSRLTIEEKEVLAARQDNLKIAEALYEELQRKALGIAPPTKGQAKGRSRGAGIGD
jgi:hypothetical protein